VTTRSTSTQPSPQSPVSYQPSPQKSGSGGTGSFKYAPTRSFWQRINMGKLWQQASRTLRGQFIALICVVLLVAVLATLVVSQAFSQTNSNLNTIAQGSVPSVDAAQAMSQYIEDIDAKAADYLAAASLTAQTPCTIIGSSRNPGNLTDHNCDALNIHAELVLANKELYLAIHNVTYPGEHTATERILAGFEEYRADIAVEEHEYALAANKTNLRDTHLQMARLAYLAATNVLNVRITQQPTLDASGNPIYDETNIPACTIEGRTIAALAWPLGSLQQNIDCLSSINQGYLTTAYNATENSLGIMILLIGLLCLAFCGLLLFITGRITALTHRIINVGLILATLLALVFSSAAITDFINMSGPNGAFALMVKDDYDSVYYAALLKRYATAANADESRWLIAEDFGDQTEINRWQQDWYTNRQRVDTLIQQAEKNKTWPEEVQPLAKMQSYWKTYTSIDPQIRTLATNTADSNRIHDAQVLSTGQSNSSFNAFTGAVDQLSQVNRNYYNRTYATTNAALMDFIPLSLVLFPLIGLLALWGTTRRLKYF
jgi:hypothetical protein